MIENVFCISWTVCTKKENFFSFLLSCLLITGIELPALFPFQRGNALNLLACHTECMCQGIAERLGNNAAARIQSRRGDVMIQSISIRFLQDEYSVQLEDHFQQSFRTCPDAGGIELPVPNI